MKADAPLFIVLNAGSGKHDAGDTQQTLAGIFDAAGRRHEFLLLDSATDIESRAKQAVRLACEQGGIVVAAGGDGTINGVAQHVLGHPCAFGVLPQGTFNYFGRVHGISQETEVAAKALLRAIPTPVQVGLVNEKVFLVNASLGLYTKLLEDRETAKAQLGRSRLVAMGAGLMTLMRERRQLRLTLEARGQSRSIRTPSVFVGNNRLQFDRLGLPEGEALEHGQLAAIVVKPTRALAMLGLALRGALGRLGDADNLIRFPMHRLTVHPHRHRMIKVATDGEVNHLRAPLVFRVAPEPLLLMVPAPEDRVEVK
ncbi:diacylglycerol kinase [Panacagrimonas perspica]|nr:diacylglycerol kinase [Panacagrimonas perspica]